MAEKLVIAGLLQKPVVVKIMSQSADQENSGEKHTVITEKEVEYQEVMVSEICDRLVEPKNYDFEKQVKGRWQWQC